MSASRLVTALGVVLVAVLAWCAIPAGAAPPCVGADMYIAAHQDDTLLFQSPDLLEDVRGNRCIRTVFTTAGDSGKAAGYWEKRETGAEAAYAQMAGVANAWTTSSLSLAGHPVRLRTLVGKPGISILFMRLPDGGIDGKGFPLYGEQSLLKLWNKGNGQMPAINEIEADDKSTKYTYSGLVQALAAAIQSFGARQVYTQNYAQSVPGPDHADHVITGRLTKSAAEALPPAFGGLRLVPYEDYEVTVRPANVFGTLLAAKEAAFGAYIPFDEACEMAGGEECETGVYPKWLARQYVETAAVKTHGVVADAGRERTVGPGAAVALSGAESSAENGGPLGYSWTQVGGPAVALNGAGTVEPTLVTPPHPTVLTFALTVNQGVVTSAPDHVRVRVPGGGQNPTAVAGADQSVAAGARVTLDGTASWDPESLPLSYSWSQVGGPAVALTGAGSSTPSFTAPAGSATTLTFSLVVSNGAQASAPATVRVAVAAAPPPDNKPQDKPKEEGKPNGGGAPSGPSGKLARKKVQLTVGRPAKRIVAVRNGLAPQSCRGRLPVGALCRINPAGNVVVEARRSLSRAGTFHLKVWFAAGATPSARPLKVVIKRAKN